MKKSVRAFRLAVMAALAVLLVSNVHAQDSPDKRQIDEIREQIRVLQQRVEELESAANRSSDPVTPVEPTEDAGEPVTQTDGEPPPPPDEAVAESDQPSSAGRTLLLPEISLIGQFSAHASSDNRDADRSRVFLDYAELGIQSYVYPGVKADAFIAMPREKDHSALVEEAYLSLLKLGPGLSARIGKTKTPFGRTNLLHLHSLLYATQARVLNNLVGAESLAGQGANLSYLIPTTGSLFAQADLGYWGSAESAEGLGDPGTEILSGTGASFRDRFGTARLWLSGAPSRHTEAEIGISHAWGTGEVADPSSETALVPAHRVRLTGADLTYRHFQGNNRRLLLRGEYYQRENNAMGYPGKAKGYYLLANQRYSQYRDIGLRYDWSQYPYIPGLHESSVSAIFTNQLTEQTYLRLQLTQGSRPGDSNYQEAWLQWVWGLGPHTHELE